MRRALWLSILSSGLLLPAGCSSTLEEYRCTTNEECTSEQDDGICHGSGYCAFPDLEACDGYRFGKHSGERSEQCVAAEDHADAAPPRPDADTSNIADASPPDARAVDADLTIPDPIANIAPINLGCDLTAVSADGTSSQSFGGTTLTNFSWTLRAPGGAVLNQLSGAPGSGFTPNRSFMTGVVATPLVNLTTYLDKSALLIDTDEGHSRIRQNDMTVPAGDYTFSFAIGVADAADIGDPVDFSIRSEIGPTYDSFSLTLTPTMTRYSVNFNVAEAASDVQISIHSDAGRYYLDNFRVHENGPDGSQGMPVVQNASLEQVLAPWFVSIQVGPSASLSRAPIPSPLKRYGDYDLELVVTDSNGSMSAPKKVSISHEACL